MNNFTHYCNKNSITPCWVIDKYVGHSSNEFTILKYRWTRHDCCQWWTTFFIIFEILKEISLNLKVIMREMKEILTEMKRIMRLIVILMRLMWGESSMQIKINITFIKWDFHIYTIGEPHFCNKSHTIFVTKKDRTRRSCLDCYGFC